jgi:hypothetical protein
MGEVGRGERRMESGDGGARREQGSLKGAIIII